MDLPACLWPECRQGVTAGSQAPCANGRWQGQARVVILLAQALRHCELQLRNNSNGASGFAHFIMADFIMEEQEGALTACWQKGLRTWLGTRASRNQPQLSISSCDTVGAAVSVTLCNNDW